MTKSLEFGLVTTFLQGECLERRVSSIAMFGAQQGRDQEVILISHHPLTVVVATWCRDVCPVLAIFKPKPILGRKEVKIV